MIKLIWRLSWRGLRHRRRGIRLSQIQAATMLTTKGRFGNGSGEVRGKMNYGTLCLRIALRKSTRSQLVHSIITIRRPSIRFLVPPMFDCQNQRCIRSSVCCWCCCCSYTAQEPHWPTRVSLGFVIIIIIVVIIM